MEGEKMLTVRLPADLLKLAQGLARSRDENLSQVVRRALRGYVDSAPRQADLVEAVRASQAAPKAKAKAPEAKGKRGGASPSHARGAGGLGKRR